MPPVPLPSEPLSFIPPDATCVGCGYRLIGLSDFTCPECGRAFYPSDPTTYRTAYERERWRRWGTPPSRRECWWTVLFGAYVLYCASCPASGGHGPIGALFCSAPVWFPLMLSFLFRLVMVAIVASRPLLEDDRAGWPKSASRMNWVWLPLFVGLSLSTIAYPWPLIVRFQLSRPAFEQAVKDVKAGTFKKPRWVGLYHVDPVSKGYGMSPGAIRFDVGNPSLPPDETGFEYAPNAPLQSQSSYQLTNDWRTYSF